MKGRRGELQEGRGGGKSGPLEPPLARPFHFLPLPPQIRGGIPRFTFFLCCHIVPVLGSCNDSMCGQEIRYLNVCHRMTCEP